MGLGAIYEHFLPSGFICSQILSTPSHTQVKQPLGGFAHGDVMSAQDRLNTKFQYYTLQLLIVIVKHLLYGSDTKDLRLLQNAELFVKDFFNGGSDG